MEETSVQISYHRQRSSTARIRDGQIVLRISTMVSRREQQEHIDHLLKQMQPKLERQESKIKLSLRSVFQEGEILLSTGIHYEVRLRKFQVPRSKVQKTGNVLNILVPIDRELDLEDAEEALWKFLERDQLPVLQERLDWLSEGWISERCEKIRLRRALSRWGSCDKREKVIMLSTKLLLVEQKLLDYVCVHELAHLKYADHSDLFWDLVSQKMPDWKVQRRKLRNYES